MSHSGVPPADLLKSLLLSDVPKDQAQAEKYGIQLFDSTYVHGNWTLHDGQPVKFFSDRYMHAFRTAGNYRVDLINCKNAVAIDRIERMMWIGKIISGQIPNCECWLVNQINGNPNPPDRLYINWYHKYGVYLWQLKSEVWKFSTAYMQENSKWRQRIKSGKGVKIWP